MAQNQIDFEILEDGTVKWTSPGGFDQEHHESADMALQMIKNLMGGDCTTETVKNNLASPHSHQHGDGKHHHHH